MKKTKKRNTKYSEWRTQPRRPLTQYTECVVREMDRDAMGATTCCRAKLYANLNLRRLTLSRNNPTVRVKKDAIKIRINWVAHFGVQGRAVFPCLLDSPSFPVPLFGLS